MTAVAKGKMYLSPSIAETVVKNSLEKLDRKDEGSSVLLSGREREVLQMIAEGKSTKEIALEAICEYQDRGNPIANRSWTNSTFARLPALRNTPFEKV